MYFIGLCDDEKVFADSLHSTLYELLSELRIPHQIDVYQNYEELENALANGQAYHLLFMDILMPGMNGIEFARRLRRFDEDTAVVFVTSSDDFILDGYDVGAFHYLLKPADKSKLRAILKKVFDRMSDAGVLIVSAQGKTRKIWYRDIIALETKAKKVAVYLYDDTVLISGKLTDFEKRLSDGPFVRCHQSYLLNFRNITEYKRNHAVARNGMIIPISRTYLQRVQQMAVTEKPAILQ